MAAPAAFSWTSSSCRQGSNNNNYLWLLPIYCFVWSVDSHTYFRLAIRLLSLDELTGRPTTATSPWPMKATLGLLSGINTAQAQGQRPKSSVNRWLRKPTTATSLWLMKATLGLLSGINTAHAQGQKPKSTTAMRLAQWQKQSHLWTDG